MIGYALFDTSLGRCAIAWTERGVAGVQLPEARPAQTIGRITQRFPEARAATPPEPIARAIADITRHLAGDVNDLSSIALDMTGVPDFFRKVYEIALAIPSGQTLAYGEIAARAGSPGASRAVGQAMGKNPFPIVVPCHRVLASGKKPGGFSAYGGAETKAKMLAIEGLVLAPPSSAATGALFAGRGGFTFDADAARRHLEAKDKRLARLIEKVGPFRLTIEQTQGTFEALAESIVYQQLTGKAAATIFTRVKALFPKKRLSPEALGRISVDALRTAGLSGSKTAALKDLAEKTLDGTVPPLAELAKLDDDAIVERLTAVRGIGRWTAEMLLIFRLGRPDVLPVADYGVRKGFARLMKREELPTPKELAAYGEKWRPFRTMASWYLWRATEL